MTLELASAPHLFSLLRSGFAEVSIRGWAFLNREGNSADNHAMPIVSRSLLKPFQAWAVNSRNPIARTEPFWALVVASHSGQARHLEQLSQLAKTLCVAPEELMCPATFPMDAEVAFQMRHDHEPASGLHHPCAGKHLNIVGLAKHLKLEAKNYIDPNHPLQQGIRAFIEERIGLACQWATDSCGLPAAVMPAGALLKLWQMFAKDDSVSAVEIKKVWVKDPILAGGVGRLDTELMQALPGQILAKEGADGLLAVQCLPPFGEETLLIKLASGYNSKYLALGLFSLLSRASQLSSTLQTLLKYLEGRLGEFVPKDQSLFLEPKLKN